MSGVIPVNGDMDNGAHAVAVDVLHTQAVHEFIVASSHLNAIHCGDHAAPADLHVGDPVAVDLFAVGALQAFADGVGGGAFCQSGKLHQLLIFHFAVMDAIDFKDALGESSGLVKDHGFGLGEGFQVVGALHQDTGMAGASNAGKKGQRDADDQSAGAANYQERQRPVNPLIP